LDGAPIEDEVPSDRKIAPTNGQTSRVSDKGPWPILLWLLAMCAFPILLGWAVLGLGGRWIEGAREEQVASRCMDRLRRLGQAFGQYAADHDGMYPPSNLWVDDLVRYAAKKDPNEQSESVFRCPAISAKRTGEYGYAMNDALSSRKQSESNQPLVFDSSEMHRNAHSNPSSLPNPPRHRSGSVNFAVFEDGQVRPAKKGR
jgi:hypothetical protein